MPKASVVIASYSHELYVRAAIESVLEQSFQDFEIVVTDDGSRDRTPDEVRAIGDARIALDVFPSNRGACVAMNAAKNLDIIRRSIEALVPPADRLDRISSKTRAAKATPSARCSTATSVTGC